jgi:transaldolase
VKNRNLLDTTYVTELIAPGVVNTMPPATLEAVADHGVISSDTVTGYIDDARQTLELLADVGVSYADVTATLEREGIEKFLGSWNALERAVAMALEHS